MGTDAARRDLIALDIETDTTPCHAPTRECCERRGLDPRIGSITAIALSTQDGEIVLEADRVGERAMLEQLDGLLASRVGVLVTWNGAVFDLPFIADRAATLGVTLGLQLTPNAEIPVKYEPLPGHTGGYEATWHALNHSDIMVPYREIAERNAARWSLKDVARSLGMNPVEVDRANMHELSADELRAYVASDAVVTRALAEQLGNL